MTNSSSTFDPQNLDSSNHSSEVPLPTGAPLTEWAGIPIMPDASAGEGDDSGYVFIVRTAPETVHKFYEETLTNLRWGILASSLDETGAVLVIAMKDEGMLTLSATPLPDGVMYVFLVK